MAGLSPMAGRLAGSGDARRASLLLESTAQSGCVSSYSPGDLLAERGEQSPVWPPSGALAGMLFTVRLFDVTSAAFGIILKTNPPNKRQWQARDAIIGEAVALTWRRGRVWVGGQMRSGRGCGARVPLEERKLVAKLLMGNAVSAGAGWASDTGHDQLSGEIFLCYNWATDYLKLGTRVLNSLLEFSTHH